MIFVAEAPALLEEAFFGAGLLSDLPADAVLVLGDRDPTVPLADLVLARSFSEESSEDLRLLDWSATALSLDGRDEVQHPRTARDPNRSCSAIWIFACRPTHLFVRTLVLIQPGPRTSSGESAGTSSPAGGMGRIGHGSRAI